MQEDKNSSNIVFKSQLLNYEKNLKGKTIIFAVGNYIHTQDYQHVELKNTLLHKITELHGVSSLILI